MTEHDAYTAKEEALRKLRRIKYMEANFIDNKISTTDKTGGYTYYFMEMMNETRKLLAITKPIQEEQNIPSNNDLTIGDLL